MLWPGWSFIQAFFFVMRDRQIAKIAGIAKIGKDVNCFVVHSRLAVPNTPFSSASSFPLVVQRIWIFPISAILAILVILAIY